MISAGLNDWGGVSPVTPDHVNPEARWPHLDELARETALAGKILVERLSIYPTYIYEARTWLDPQLVTPVLHLSDSDGLARVDLWSPGENVALPQHELSLITNRHPETPRRVSPDVEKIIAKAFAGEELTEQEVERLFQARGDDFAAVCQAADTLRQQVNGDSVSYVVNRNINYTNICYFRCQFCAFSKGKMSENLRGAPYDLALDEIIRRAQEAWARGGTEVCMQGGIHPEYTGETYLNMCRAIKAVLPAMHIHAFSPLKSGRARRPWVLSVHDFLVQFVMPGLSTLPGTAAEILDDEVRADLCPDKINTEQWLTSSRKLIRLPCARRPQLCTGILNGLFMGTPPATYQSFADAHRRLYRVCAVTLCAYGGPIFWKGRARKGPTFREAILVHAVARLVLYPHITNIQVSWVKMGEDGIKACLQAGVTTWVVH